MNIAKKDWGNSNNVYFSFDGIDSDGNYRVCVRNNSTTYTIRTYIININTGTFTIKD